MSEAEVIVQRDGPIAHVILNRPNARNALNLPMCHRLSEAVEQLSFDASVHVVIVSGNGSTFCAGADMKERADHDDAWILKRRHASFHAYASIEKCTKPVVAAVHGNIIGSGGEIAMACDFIIAAQDAKFRFPEAHWGTIGATQRLQRVIGKSRAKELLFTNRILPTEEAYQLGLVARIVAPEALLETAKKVATDIAAAPPQTLSLTKQCVELGALTDLDGGIRIELAAIERNLSEGKWRDGFDQFAEKIAQKKP